MTKYVEITLDNAIISGEVARYDATYDDAFGQAPGYQYEVTHLAVTVWIETLEYQVIFVQERDKQYWSSLLIEQAVKDELWD